MSVFTNMHDSKDTGFSLADLTCHAGVPKDLSSFLWYILRGKNLNEFPSFPPEFNAFNDERGGGSHKNKDCHLK